MMNQQLLAVVNYIEKERGVGREVVLTAIQQAMQQAARHNAGFTKDCRVEIDRANLNIKIFDTLVVSDTETGAGFVSLARARRHKPDAQPGDTIEIEVPATRLGRIAAQATRQVITMKIREAERTNLFSEYKDRLHEIVTGTVSNIVKRDIYVMVGKSEMILPWRERIPSEELNVGDSVRAMIVRVDPDAVGRPAVTLSRACNEFVKVLFRLEVSEIADGTVEIMSVARDPGYRCKIAVRSLDDKVDPVGACVGQRGARVRNIVTELCGEKIDVVRWSDDIKTFVAQALLPAKLDSIEIDSDSRRLVDVVVAPDQYKLAIGKSGHNVRLTSQLVGWRVEVRKSLAGASFEEQKAQAVKTLADTFSIPTAKATQIADAGFLTVEGIITADEATFAASTGLDPVAARGIYAAAQAVAELTGVGRDAAAETPAEEPAADAEEPAYAEPAAGDPAQETTPGAEG